jgi:hypothetical protein
MNHRTLLTILIGATVLSFCSRREKSDMRNFGSMRCLTMLYAMLLVVFAASGEALAQTGAAQSRVSGQRGLPNSLTLRGDDHATTMQRLRFVRQYKIEDLRSRPQIMLGTAKLDFTPVLNNPKALFNIALRLRAMPKNVEVKEDTSEISEVDQGLVLHHVLSYRILPGKCADPGVQAQLAQAGVACFTKESANQRMAEFATPGHARYVADPVKRQAAIASYQQNSALADADASKHIADLRKSFADPKQRATLVAQLGAAEVTRISNLNDDQLKAEIINSSVQRVEQTAFVYKLDSSQYAHPTTVLRITPSAQEMAAGKQLLHTVIPEGGAANSQFPKMLVVEPAANFHAQAAPASPKNATDQTTDMDLGSYIYLTGFTFSHDYEWSIEVDTTINWCLIGCSSTYSVRVFAGFNYGFGLRFPIQTQLKYHNVVHPNQTADASLTADFAPIKASAAQFQLTGLEHDQIFDGKELVAQVGADAGFNFNLPIVGSTLPVIGSKGMKFTLNLDFTDILPSPYNGGIFTPPAPGAHGYDNIYKFDQIDFLGGLLDFGVVSGKIFPALDINLHSNKLQFTLNDEVFNKQFNLFSPGQTVSLGTDKNKKFDSHFSFGNPVYNLGFTLTPGIDAQLAVDLAVWSQTWDWIVWFPQVAVDLPPGGIDFGCHAGTTCVRDFQPVAGKETSSTGGGAKQQLQSEGCTVDGNKMICGKIMTYQACQNALNANALLGIKTCDPGMLLKEEDSADRTLTGGGCQRSGAGIFCTPALCHDYLCPVGMLGLCNDMLKNGVITSCTLLVPPAIDQELKKAGCNCGGVSGKVILDCLPGNYYCSPGGMAKCNQFVKEEKILSCKPNH